MSHELKERGHAPADDHPGVTTQRPHSERHPAEERLRASEEQWRTLVENAPVTILTVDRAGTILTFSRSLFGRPAAELIGKCIHDLALGDGARERSIALLERVFGDGTPVSFEVDASRPDGGAARMQNTFAPLRNGAGEVISAIGVGMDVSARHEALQALRESEQRFRDIVHSLGDWVWEVDAAGQLVYSSPQIESLLGYTAEEMLGRSASDTRVPDERRRFLSGQDSLLSNPAAFRDREIWHRHKDGRRVCLSLTGVPVHDADGSVRGFRGVGGDVTERKREEEERRRLEAEVQQSRRIESLGLLAGGIAHDFNNLLTAILGNAELALAEMSDGGARPLVAQIQAAGQHAADLTRQMLAYAGRGRMAAEPVNMTGAVREMVQLLGASIPKKVELDLDLADGIPPVEADPAQFRQVVMNLVINAADAIGDRSGRISVRTMAGRPADGLRADLALGRIDERREVACIEIADNGSGIAPDALVRIFDPFFTTKFTGRGLGLAAVQGIVLRHGGTITVSSTPGRGSVFRVCFPALAADAADAGARPRPACAPDGSERSDSPWRGSGTILVVDDEEPVRTMASRMLKALGFQVLAAADGREAVSVAAGAPSLRAVLLDQTMPHMDGRETFRELQRLQPGLPVVLCSGYDVIESTDRFADMDVSGFLQKPYRLDDLARALRKALGE